ncbi:MAG: hypothetical protein P0Y55_06385 [Candidatus Cohnella colombiensis]|uniref:Uncharacterized protein n=1 Tax=Candidatus Cohnella colombiensis TaxID=3121368 RepID=A0AA95JCV9_9BACL|nr:MAG: hypothetical protein P0Y55_06385 [Cohnella sp.]
MNPMFIAIFLWLAAVILWWCGWRAENESYVSQKAVAIALFAWPFMMNVHIRASTTWLIHGGWIWMLVIALVLLWKLERSIGWLASSTGLLLGAIELLLHRMVVLPKGTLIVIASWGSAIFIGLLASLLLRGVASQIVAISLGILLLVAYNGFTETAWVPMADWWIALFSVRFFGLLLKTFAQWLKILNAQSNWNRRRQRS